MHAPAGPEEIDHGKSDDESKRRQDLEINQRFGRYPPDLLGFPYGGNAMNYCAENDQPDKHRNQADEQIANGGASIPPTAARASRSTLPAPCRRKPAPTYPDRMACLRATRGPPSSSSSPLSFSFTVL